MTTGPAPRTESSSAFVTLRTRESRRAAAARRPTRSVSAHSTIVTWSQGTSKGRSASLDQLDFVPFGRVEKRDH